METRIHCLAIDAPIPLKLTQSNQPENALLAPALILEHQPTKASGSLMLATQVLASTARAQLEELLRLCGLAIMQGEPCAANITRLILVSSRDMTTHHEAHLQWRSIARAAAYSAQTFHIERDHASI